MSQQIHHEEGEPKPAKRRTFWSKLETFSDGMELALRLIFGIAFACLFSWLGWELGSLLVSLVGYIAAFVAFPIGFLLGFFWVEVKTWLSW